MEIPLLGAILRSALKSRRFQFFLILPSLVLLCLVLISGMIGTTDPTKNFATVITWYVWFNLLFPLTLIGGRVWCATCPFGGLGEWVQRKTLWTRKEQALGLGWRIPAPLAKYGLLISVLVLLGLTWAEEFFNIAGPGAPILTSVMVLGLLALSLVSFLVFERRSFCRYLCPLSSLIGVAGSTSVLAGFRPKDREKCVACDTKNCLRGGVDGYGCPWYTYPGSADTNAYCGLCSECMKTCPNENISLYAQEPLASVIAAKKKPMVAWVAAILFGLVLFQQWNALPSYTAVDGWLNSVTRFRGYPNPVDYIVSIGAVAGGLAGLAWLMSRVLALEEKGARAFSAWFAPMMYGLIPLIGCDFLARVLPKFFNHAGLVVSSVAGVFGRARDLAEVHMLPNVWVMRAQYLVVGLGVVGAVWATARIAGREYRELTQHHKLVRIVPSAIATVLGVGLVVLYHLMKGAE